MPNRIWTEPEPGRQRSPKPGRNRTEILARILELNRNEIYENTMVTDSENDLALRFYYKK